MEKINYEDILIISCILGDKYTIIYDAPASSPNCYFFTNNQTQKDTIISKGWNYEYVDIEMTDEEIPCSLQAKYIKFLQFLDDYGGKFKKFKQILYFDHKHNVLEKDVKTIIDLSNKYENKFNVLIRPHEKTKKLWQEVDDSMYQYKYKKNIGKTINMINAKKEDGSLKDDENIPIAVTSLIFYNNYDEIMPMLDEIYKACIDQQQPECQILWAVFSQKYADKIKLVDFQDMNPETIWIYPPYPWVDTTNIPIEYFTSITDTQKIYYYYYSLFLFLFIFLIIVFYYVFVFKKGRWYNMIYKYFRSLLKS